MQLARLTDMLFGLAVKSFLWFVSFSFTQQNNVNFKEESRVALHCVSLFLWPTWRLFKKIAINKNSNNNHGNNDFNKARRDGEN